MISDAGQLAVHLAKQTEYSGRMETCLEEKRGLYEQLVLQQISAEEYKKQTAVIDRELEQLREIHSHLKTQITQMEMDEKAKAARTDLARQAAESSGLTSQLADALIERVYVYPDNQVEIIWKTKDFIGMEAAR